MWPYTAPASFILLISSCTPSLLLSIANDVTGNPASQAYPVSDKGIIVLSQLGLFVLFITLGKGHEMGGMQQGII